MWNILKLKLISNFLYGFLLHKEEGVIMKKKQIIGIVVAVVLFIMCGMVSKVTNSFIENMLLENAIPFTNDNSLSMPTEDMFPEEPYIAIVEVSGTIQEQGEMGAFGITEGYQHNDTMDYIDLLISDDNNAAILLYVDSPGGTVYESEELYDKLKEYKQLTERPIWTYMAHYAASGGYMISMASDNIYANKNTTTGSIGVITSRYDITGLYDKLGVQYVSITSGQNKDGSILSDEKIAILQSQIDEYYESFVEIVSDGRNMPIDEVKKLADGRTYTAKQALDHGLIDHISSFEKMKEEMSESLDVIEYYEPVVEENIFASLFAQIKDIIPKSEAQILFEAAREMEREVFMYYAR